MPELSDAPYTTERREWNGAQGTGSSVRWSWRWSDDFCFGVACGMAGVLCTEVVGEGQDADPLSAAAATLTSLVADVAGAERPVAFSNVW